MAIGFITKDFERKCPEFGAKWGRSVISSVTDFVKSCHNTQFATKEWVYRSLRELFVESGEETFEEIFLDVWQIFGRDRKVMFLPDKYMMLRAYNYDHSEVDGFVKQFKVLVNDFEFSMNTIPELVRKGLSTMKEPIDEEYALYTISKMLVKSENHAHTVTKFNVSLYRLASMFRQKVLFLIGEDRLEALTQIKDTLGYYKLSTSELIARCEHPQEVYRTVVQIIRKKLSTGVKVAVELPSINPSILCNIFNRYYNKGCRSRQPNERFNGHDSKNVPKSIGAVIYVGSTSGDKFKKIFNAMDENDVFIPFEVAKIKT